MIQQTTYTLTCFLLWATLANAQIWKSGAEVLAALPPNFTYNTVCFETPPNAGGEQEVTKIDLSCDQELRPENSHAPYCVSLYTTTGQLLETFEQVSTIVLELETPTIVVVSGHRIGSVENILSLGLYYPLPDIEVENDCETITFSTEPTYHLKINGEVINNHRKHFLIEDLSDSDVLQVLDFNVELVFLEENNNLNCGEISTLQYSYLPPAINLPTDTILCSGANLGLQTLFHPTFAYEWDTGGEAATTLINHIDQDSAISVLVTNGLGCQAEATVLVEIADLTLPLPNDTVVASGRLLTLCVPAQESWRYQWSNGDTNFCTSIQVQQPTTVWVTAQNEVGCSATDTINIRVTNPEPTVIIEKPRPKTTCTEGIFIPNVLDLSSPTKENRVFQVFSKQTFEQVAIAKIFDRQGALLVQKQGFSQDLVIWEGEYRGRPVNNGVFAYWMVIETSHDEWITCQGDITVIGGRR